MRRLFVLMFAVLSVCHAAAQTTPDDVRWEKQMQQMTVTATRVSELMADTTVAMRVIGREDIERSDVRTVADLLQQELPGISFSLSVSRDKRMNMSGFGGGSIVFLVDGERLAGESQGNIDFERLVTDNIERIEITRGAASAAYGSDGVCAVINIVTRRTTRRLLVGAGVKSSSRNNHQADVRLGNSGRIFGNDLSARWGYSGAYTLSPFAGAVGRQLVVRKGYTYGADDRFRCNVAQWLELSGRCGYYFRERDYDATLSHRYRDFSGSLAAKFMLGHGASITARYVFDQYDKSDLSLITDKDIRIYSNVLHNTGLLCEVPIRDFWRLRVGAEVIRHYLMSSLLGDDCAREQYRLSAFSEAEWKPSDRFSLMGGLRYDRCSDSETVSLTAKLSARWDVSRTFSLRAGYGGGFVPATLKERFMNYDMSGVFMIYGNEHLQPERSHNLQLSAVMNRNGWYLTASFLYSALHNHITTLWDKTADGLGGNRGAMRYVNVRRKSVSAAEANIAKRFDRHWDARLGYSYTYVHIPRGVEYSDDTRPHSLTARVSYSTTFGRMIYQTRDATFKSHRLNVSLSARYSSALYIREFNSTYLKLNAFATRYNSFAIVRLSTQLSTPKGFFLSLSADNLFNYRPAVYTYYSPQTMGIEVSLSVKYQFD